jgi:hypothetical protein
MDLLLDLSANDGIWIDGTHRIFEKSEFEGLNFRVKIKPLTRTTLRKLQKTALTKTGVDQNIYLPRVFMDQVVDWELKDGNGKPIPFTEDNKKVLAEQFPGLTNLIAVACIDAQARAAEAVEEETKN